MSTDPGRVVIVGAGLAGAATAFGMVRRGFRDIEILEQEGVPGYYASGRNAAMIREWVPRPEMRRLIRRSLAFIAEPPRPFPAPLGFRRSGSLLLAAADEAKDLRSWVDADKVNGSEVQFLSAQEVRNRISVVSADGIETAAWAPGDGVADIHGLLQGFLDGARRAGARIRFRTRVAEITRFGNRITGIRTDSGDRIECSTLVNAAGPWAGRVGELAGIGPVRFSTLRRHLFQSGPLPGINPGWPFVWDITHGIYFRPESGGVLLCACDEGPMEPCDPPVDAAEAGILAEKVARHLPGLSGVQLLRSWACIRTFSSDRGLIVGWEPETEGFFWCAALGGHGVGLAPALSELVSDMILDGRSPLLDDEGLSAISPDRFSSAKTSNKVSD